MWYAHEHADALLFGTLDEAAAGVLLKHVVNDLKGRNPTAPEQRQSFVLPAVGGAERGAVAADLTLRLERLESLEKLVAADCPHARVMNLVDVDVIGAQAPQALLNSENDVLGRKVLRQFLVAVAVARVAVDVVPELGSDDDAVADFAERICENRLAFALTIRVGGVEECSPGIVGLPQQVEAALIVFDAPPAGADRPEPEADGRDLNRRIAESAVLHVREHYISASLPARKTDSSRFAVRSLEQAYEQDNS